MTTETEFDAVKWIRKQASFWQYNPQLKDYNDSLLRCAAELASAKEQAAAAQAENLRLRGLLNDCLTYWLQDADPNELTDFVELYRAALAQPPSRAALDEYVAERVKRLEDRMRQWAMENLQSGSPRRESFYAVLEKEVVKS